MKRTYSNPIVDIIDIGYGVVETLLTESTDRGERPPLSFGDILNGDYAG